MASKNRENSFVIEIGTKEQDPNLFYKKGFMEELKKYPHLTVSGQNPPPAGRGVQYASHGNLITVGTADNHDIEWIERPNYARERGLTPVLNLVKDWDVIVAKLKTYADSKLTYTTDSGHKVTLTPNYVKIGLKAYPYSEISVVLTKNDIVNLYFSMR